MDKSVFGEYCGAVVQQKFHLCYRLGLGGLGSLNMDFSSHNGFVQNLQSVSW